MAGLGLPLPLEIGIEKGIWPKYGIEPVVINGSGAKLIKQ